MDYHKFAAICCLLAVLNVCGTDGRVFEFDSVVAATPGDTSVTTALVSATAAGGGATGTAGITFRDGLRYTDGTLLTVHATVVGTDTYALDTTSLTTFDIVAGTGVITMKVEETLPYATNSIYTVSVTATDSSDNDTGVLTLSVTVNGMPTFSDTPVCLNIAHGTEAGTTLYMYTIADPEGSDVITKLDNPDSNPGDAYFTYQAGNLVTAKAMDMAAGDIAKLTIQAVDAGTPPSTAYASVLVVVLDAGTGTGT